MTQISISHHFLRRVTSICRALTNCDNTGGGARGGGAEPSWAAPARVFFFFSGLFFRAHPPHASFCFRLGRPTFPISRRSKNAQPGLSNGKSISRFAERKEKKKTSSFAPFALAHTLTPAQQRRETHKGTVIFLPCHGHKHKLLNPSSLMGRKPDLHLVFSFFLILSGANCA